MNPTRLSSYALLLIKILELKPKLGIQGDE